ncbi:basic salivary proline-rich protein 2-like [Perognathus longimembris pacificus]|uniref:basic salivary proline-rich protein 2-like n=1 Tax=Perognathus longimembris pacificus TaxID=214514 RepID=UPI002019145A|nr:basic salivary proline-rich protein 2-like [Perognathus longimembris pacificus]
MTFSRRARERVPGRTRAAAAGRERARGPVPRGPARRGGRPPRDAAVGCSRQTRALSVRSVPRAVRVARAALGPARTHARCVSLSRRLVSLPRRSSSGRSSGRGAFPVPWGRRHPPFAAARPRRPPPRRGWGRRRAGEPQAPRVLQPRSGSSSRRIPGPRKPGPVAALSPLPALSPRAGGPPRGGSPPRGARRCLRGAGPPIPRRDRSSTPASRSRGGSGGGADCPQCAPGASRRRVRGGRRATRPFLSLRGGWGGASARGRR